MHGGLAAIHQRDIRQRLPVFIAERRVQEAHIKTGGRIASIHLHPRAGRREAGPAGRIEFRHRPPASPKARKCINVRPDANGDLVGQPIRQSGFDIDERK